MTADFVEGPSTTVQEAEPEPITATPISKSECVLAVSQSVFSILKNVSQISTIPCLQEAATLACTLLQMVQDMKSNKDAYKGIVHEICTLLVCISMQPGEMSESLKADLEHLVKELEAIKKLCLRLAARNRVIRFILSRKDAGDINKIRSDVEFTFKVFYLKSTISIRAIQESWSGKDNTQSTQLLLSELKSQREMMEKTGKTLAALQIPASVPDNSARPARAMQEFNGNPIFEDEVQTANIHQGGSDVIFYSPMQSFSGNATFKGKVITINRIN